MYNVAPPTSALTHNTPTVVTSPTSTSSDNVSTTSDSNVPQLSSIDELSTDLAALTSLSNDDSEIVNNTKKGDDLVQTTDMICEADNQTDHQYAGDLCELEEYGNFFETEQEEFDHVTTNDMDNPFAEYSLDQLNSAIETRQEDAAVEFDYSDFNHRNEKYWDIIIPYHYVMYDESKKHVVVVNDRYHGEVTMPYHGHVRNNVTHVTVTHTAVRTIPAKQIPGVNMNALVTELFQYYGLHIADGDTALYSAPEVTTISYEVNDALDYNTIRFCTYTTITRKEGKTINTMDAYCYVVDFRNIVASKVSAAGILFTKTSKHNVVAIFPYSQTTLYYEHDILLHSIQHVMKELSQHALSAVQEDDFMHAIKNRDIKTRNAVLFNGVLFGIKTPNSTVVDVLPNTYSELMMFICERGRAVGYAPGQLLVHNGVTMYTNGGSILDIISTEHNALQRQPNYHSKILCVDDFEVLKTMRTGSASAMLLNYDDVHTFVTAAYQLGNIPYCTTLCPNGCVVCSLGN